MSAPRKPVKPTTVLGHEIATPVEGELVTLKAQGPKPGWATTEFWIALAPIVGAALALFHVTAAPAQVRDVLIAVAGLVAAAYALSRGIVKAAHSKDARQLPPLDEAGHSTLGVVLFVVAVILILGFGFAVNHLILLLLILALLLLVL